VAQKLLEQGSFTLKVLPRSKFYVFSVTFHDVFQRYVSRFSSKEVQSSTFYVQSFTFSAKSFKFLQKRSSSFTLSLTISGKSSTLRFSAKEVQVTDFRVSVSKITDSRVSRVTYLRVHGVSCFLADLAITPSSFSAKKFNHFSSEDSAKFSYVHITPHKTPNSAGSGQQTPLQTALRQPASATPHPTNTDALRIYEFHGVSCGFWRIRGTEPEPPNIPATKSAQLAQAATSAKV
jgi:hypothetical protein